MQRIILRPATNDDAAFALHVTEACMRLYAEQTWGAWNGLADFDPSFDKILQLAGIDIGLVGVERYLDHWLIRKLYLLPLYQNRGHGSYLLQGLKREASAARVPLRLTVLEVNPARRFYERHGFVLTETISPRHHMEWRPAR
jgi:GNAT superfamily N-acetyltransferase